MHTPDHDHGSDHGDHDHSGSGHSAGNAPTPFDVELKLPDFTLNNVHVSGATLDFEGTAKIGQNGHHDVIHLTEIEVSGINGVNPEMNLLPHPITITGATADTLVQLAETGQFGLTFGHSA